jgi:PEP-CTERM motif
MNLKFAVAASMLLAAQAQALETSYADRAPFGAALGGSVTDDYSNPGYVFRQSNIDMSAVLGETDYQSTAFEDANYVSSGRYCAGCNGSFTLSFGTTSVTQGNGVFGVGFDYFNAGDPSYDALVTFADGDSELYTLDLADFHGALAFWGLTSTRQIASIAFGPNGGLSASGSFGIDNLTVGAIPEPTTWAMLIIGVGLVGAAGRSRRFQSLMG